MMDLSLAIGYTASGTSLIAFGSQLYHTYKTKTTVGLSLQRTLFDSLSLGLWVLYATRVEDIPLLIATTAELFFSLGICLLLIRHRRSHYAIKDITPPGTPPLFPSESVLITIRPRSNSV